MRSAEPYRGCLRSRGRPRIPSRRQLSPFATTWWAGSAPSAFSRRAVEGGNYRVTVSLTRTLLWLYSPGIFDKDYARATAGSSDEHADIAPDLFTAETPLGTYQGITEKLLSRTPASFRTVLMPRGSSKPEWLER